jgi:hypothetical protein
MSGGSGSDFWTVVEQQSSAQATADIVAARARKRRRVTAPGPSGEVTTKQFAGLEAVMSWQAKDISNGLPSAARKRVNAERVVVRVMPSVYINAVTVPAKDGSFFVIMNVGLMMFIYKFARALTTHLIAAETTDPVTLETTVARVANLLDWATSPAMTPRSVDWPIEKPALRAAENCAQVAERYALCHEFAHILGEHFTDAPQRYVDIDGIGIPSVETTIQRELEADLIGLKFALGAGSDGSHLQKLYLGCELFFSALALYESILGCSDEYPPASLRLKLVRDDIAKKWPVGLDAVAKHYGKVIAPLLAQVPETVMRQRALIGPSTQHYFNRYANEGTEGESQRAFFDWGSRFLEHSPGAVLGLIERELRNERVGPDGTITPEGLRRWNLAYSFANNLPPDLRTAMLPWKQDPAVPPPGERTR